MTPPTPQISRADVAHSLQNPAKFAEILCREPLWEHQRAVVCSPARFRTITAGRQSGKSRTVAVTALHQAYTKPRSTTLIISAGEVSAQRLLGEAATLSASPLLTGSVVDETKSSVSLSNGSVIMSVPASQRQIRGWAVDLLILDEAGFIDPNLWRAAEPTIIARPGSRVILCSSPWGGADHFFRQLWQRGMDRPDAMYQSWHWPSSISPLVDAALLEEIRKRETDEYFRREYLAEWTDASGQFFSEGEISDAIGDYPLLDLETMRRRLPWNHEARDHDRVFTACAGIDWGFAQDAQAIVLVSALDDGGLNDGDALRYFVPFLEARFRCSYADWIGRVTELATWWHLPVIASETNGVGAFPTEDLQRKAREARTRSMIVPVWTDVRRKMSMFGKVKTLLQQGLLTLPREPELLKQLRALEFEQLQGGSMRISVPERAGHDDLAMALGQAVSCVRPRVRAEGEVPRRALMPYTATGAGTRVPVAGAWPVEWHRASFRAPSGGDRSTDAAW
jgi:Terminase large subunit, T4likevirus-type, N-terminal